MERAGYNRLHGTSQQVSGPRGRWASRRHCDDLIAAGRVKVNGVQVTELGPEDRPRRRTRSRVDDQPVQAEKLVYWAVNKPRRPPLHQPRPGRPAAGDRPVPHVEQRVYTVGRLDEDSEGLLLMTNDGDLAMRLMHPRFGVQKTYHVLVAGQPTPDDLQKLLDGVWLSEGKVKAKSVKRVKPQGNSTWLRSRADRGEEPRDPPDARQARPQGDAAQARSPSAR